MKICSYGEWNIAKKLGVNDSKMVFLEFIRMK